MKNTVRNLIILQLSEQDLDDKYMICACNWVYDFKIDALDFEFKDNAYQLDLNCAIEVKKFDGYANLYVHDYTLIVHDSEPKMVDVRVYPEDFIKKFTDRVNDNLELF